MKKHKYLLFTILLSLLIPTITYADCTQEELEKFKEIEDQYTVTYEFNIDSKKYTLTISNPHLNDFSYTSKIFENIDNISKPDEETLKIENLNYGEYEINVISNDEQCEVVYKTISVKLPKYNPYYGDPLCEGIEEFVLCQPTYDKDIDYDTFVSRVEAYKKSKKENPSSSSSSKKEKKENKTVKYVEDNIVEIIVGIVFAIVVIITIILSAKSIRKSRRLE